VKDAFDLLLGVLLGSFLAPACEYLVSVMMVMIVIVATTGAILTVLVVMFVMMLMLVIVTTASAILAVLVVMLVMMLMLVIVTTASAILTVLVVMFVMMLMLVIVTTASAILAVFMVMLVMMFVFMLMIVIVTAAGAILAVFMVVMMAVLQKLGKLTLKGVSVLHSGNDVSTAEQIPIGGNNCSVIVEILNYIQSALKLFLGNICGVGENYGVCKLDLIVEKLAEILRVLFTLICVNNGGKAVKYHILGGNVLHRLDNVGELANARGLDEDTLGSVGLNHLGESLAEIAHKGAADAARVHFGNLNARVLHKSAVDADRAEFIFNKNELFARKSLFDKLFDKRGLTRAQKS